MTDLENLQLILIHQRNKLAFRILASRFQCDLFSLLVETDDQNITNSAKFYPQSAPKYDLASIQEDAGALPSAATAHCGKG